MNIKLFIQQCFYPIYIRFWAERFYKIKEGQIIIDAGAYLGSFTLYVAKRVGKTGKVIAFEPDPNNFKILESIIEKSGLQNIILIKKALGNVIKEVELESVNHFSSVVIKTFKNPIFKVQQTTLDEEMKKLKIMKVHFIKMNIEGAEINAIKGAKQTLANVEHIAISCHAVNGKNTENEINPLLRKFGLKTKVLKRRKIVFDLGHIDVYGYR
ncbi:MAG: FkbM family methyltransferase [Patescibacteria group bacterium]